MNTIVTPTSSIEMPLDGAEVMSDIKKTLKKISDVASMHVSATTKNEQLNSTTIKAIEDVKAGKTYKASSVENLIAQCLE